MITIYENCCVFPAMAPTFLTQGMKAFYVTEGVSEEKRVGVLPSTDATIDLSAEAAGRLCYMSYNTPRPGGNKEYLRHILEVDHGSVLEHASVSFILTGVSRTLTHELVRHRAGMAYSQLSQRYVDESEVSIVVPPDRLPYFRTMYNLLWEELWKTGVDKEKYKLSYNRWGVDLSPTMFLNLMKYARITLVGPQAELHLRELAWLQDCVEAFVHYNQDVEAYTKAWKGTNKDLSGNKTELRKAVRQMARSILPNCTETKIFVTGNIRAWRHIMKMRGSLAADVEIRRLAVAIFAVLKDLAPNSFQDMEVVEIDDKQYIRSIN